jgi:beta-mannosidase
MFIENFDFNITMSVYNANKTDLESWTIDVDLGIKMNYDNLPAKSLATVKIAIDEIAFSHSSVYHIEDIKDKLNIRILLATKNNIELWWPNGYGKQKLYNLTVEVDIGDKKLIKTKTFGFRKVELVQEELQDGLSFYFKINNIPIFLKGKFEPKLFKSI